MADVLIVAGGGGGGSIGGGGGGSVIHAIKKAIPSGEYSIHVGNGGEGGYGNATGSGRGLNGIQSQAFGSIADGGGGVSADQGSNGGARK